MSAPKIITMRLKRAPTKDGAVFIPYIERKDGQLFRMPIPKTQYTRSDLVEALVKAVKEHNEWLDKLAIQMGSVGMADLSGAIWTKQRNLSQAIKALEDKPHD